MQAENTPPEKQRDSNSQQSAGMLDLARQYVESGFSLVPKEAKLDKRPIVSLDEAVFDWRPYQSRRPDDIELQYWFDRPDNFGISLLAGEISNNLEIIDIDDIEAVAPYIKKLQAEKPELYQKLAIVKTPSEKAHIYYRCDKIDKRLLLARKPLEVEVKGEIREHWEIVIETRGEGSLATAPGSPPACHPDNKPYEVVKGDVFNPPKISEDERQYLHDLAKSFNTYQPANKEATPRQAKEIKYDGLKPGEEYNVRGDYEAVLERNGWQKTGSKGSEDYWRKPGSKKRKGHHATWNYEGSGTFYVFSTDAPPFEPDKGYSKFAIYAELEHNGDYKAAATALRSEGYGGEIITAEDEPLPTPADAPKTKRIRHSDSWSDPRPIQAELLPVAQFSPDMLPAIFRDYCADIAKRMQCPTEFIAVPLMVIASSLIGTGCAVKPKQYDDWSVVPNLWGGLIGNPGRLKSPAINEPMKILVDLEKIAFDENKVKGKEFETDKVIHEAKKTALKEQAKKAVTNKSKRADSNEEIEEVRASLVNLAEPEPPVCRRYKTNDVTIEKLGELLNENPRGLLVYRDELVGLFSTWEKDDHAQDRAFFLEAWNGNGSFTTDRIGRGTKRTENMCVSILGGIQPQKLASHLISAKRGNNNDGLLQRLQLMVYPDDIKNWELIDEPPDKIAKGKVQGIFSAISSSSFEQVGAKRDLDGRSFLNFTPEGQLVFNQWLTDLERKVRTLDDDPLLIEHLSKYRSLMPSLALTIHLAQQLATNAPQQDGITKQAAEMAVAWCEYLETHARRIYGIVGNPAEKAASILADKIKKGTLGEKFSIRDIYRKGWQHLDTKEIVIEACQILEDESWIKVSHSQTEPSPGRSKSQEYLVNPSIIKDRSNVLK